MRVSFYVSVCIIFGIFIPTFAQHQEQKCANAGGVCKNENDCSETKLVGYCPTQPNHIKCCVSSSVYQEQKCADAHGDCKNENDCSGTKLVGYCPTQPNHIKCCVPKGDQPYPEQKCINAGGVCKYENDCSERKLVGYCPTQANNIKCCVPDHPHPEPKCTNAGGECKNENDCSGTKLVGYCPTQANHIKCCVSTPKPPYIEQKCINAGGVCKNENDCSGTKLVGYCPTQANHIKCCVPGCGCHYEYAGTKCSGGPTPGAIRLANHFKAKYGGFISEIYNCRKIAGTNSLSLHAEGRAVDVAIRGSIGQQAFDYAISIACKTGIQEVIFEQKIWTNGKTKFYAGKDHYDHVHIGLNRCGAQNWNI
uniref:ARB-07466-like C-terminal domain-containing protein n=1 Tax=Acrobeloides nanus TaxID=290746 RepID=A0A914EDR0_9BILA